MKPLLAWSLIIQVTLSSPFSDIHNVDSLQPRPNEQTSHTSPTTPFTTELPSSKVSSISPHLGQDKEATQISSAAGPNSGDSSSKPRDAFAYSTAIEERGEEKPKVMRCSVWVTDAFNIPQVEETKKWLEGLVIGTPELEANAFLPWGPDEIPHDDIDKWLAEGTFDEEMEKAEVVKGWHYVNVDADGFEKIKEKSEWIKDIVDMGRYRVVEMRAISKAKVKTHRVFKPRAVNWGTWKKQENAAKDLAQVSLYEGSNLDDMKNYVYEEKAAKGVVVYVIDHGVEVDVKNENGEKVFSDFAANNRGILTTRRFLNQNAPHNTREDHNRHGHGTKVASKIVGQWGIAKDATLVPVQIEPDVSEDMSQAFKYIHKDIMRRKTNKAVVVMSRGVEEPKSKEKAGWTREEAESSVIGKDFIDSMTPVLEYGVPIVLSSGNNGAKDERKVIDTIPQVLEKDDLPIINVGATTLEGKATPYTQGQGSQDGTQLTIYAVGDNVQVHGKEDGKETQDSGTSFAAPAVGGVIAMHMNYDSFDQKKKGMERVKEIKRFIRSPASSWERMKNQNPDKPDMKVNMIWNGADKAAHRQADGTTCDKLARRNLGADETAHRKLDGTTSNQLEGRTLVVGLEQVATSGCETFTGVGLDAVSYRTCSAPLNYRNRYFFYHLEHDEEVGSLCTSHLNGFHQDDQDMTSDEKLFENPTWPKGEWTLDLFGEKFTYKNDGRDAGALWKGDRMIGCDGDLTHHDPKSDEWCENSLTESEDRSRKRRRLHACKW